MHFNVIHNTHKNIGSWCQKVLDLLDLTFAELLGITWNISLDTSPFLQMREEISEQFEQLVKLVDFMEYPRYFQEIYPSHTNSETKKV